MDSYTGFFHSHSMRNAFFFHQGTLFSVNKMCLRVRVGQLWILSLAPLLLCPLIVHVFLVFGFLAGNWHKGYLSTFHVNCGVISLQSHRCVPIFSVSLDRVCWEFVTPMPLPFVLVYIDNLCCENNADQWLRVSKLYSSSAGKSLYKFCPICFHILLTCAAS
jgi:hypothetical protein